MKKWMLLLGALVCVIMIAGCDKKSYSMDQVDSKAYITPDGDLYVEELFTYTFKGKFEGTTRYISPGEHDGIEFFEAYVPPKGKKLGEFSYENLERLKTEWDGENETYYVYDAAKDETKQVYYRYRIDKAAVKYSDVGELDWSFFKNNNQEINHVTLDVFLPSGYNKADVHAFLHDRTGGRITTGGDSAVHYENPKLSEYGEAHLLLLFPQEQLSQMAATDKKISPAELLQKERKREKRMDARDGIMRQAGTVLQVLTAVILLGALYSVLSVKRISAWFGRRDVTERDLEELDPLMKTYCMRKGKLKSKDVIAGLLSLRSRGYVTVKEVQASKRFLEEPTAPDATLEFTFHGNKAKLNAADRILVGWLFNQRNVFRLDSMAAPTFKEKQDDRQISEYRKQSQRNAKKFNKWRETLAQTEPYGTEVKFNALLKLLVPLIVIVHYVLLLYLYYADVIPIAGMIAAAVLLGIVGILACVKTKTKRWFITYLVGCFIAGTQITHEQGMENYLLFAVSSIVFAVLVPKTVLSKEMLKYRFALLELRKKLLKGEDESGVDPAAAERAAEHAVLLGIVPKYVKNLQKKGVHGLALGAAALPVLLNAELMASLAYTQNHLNFTLPRSPYGSSDGGGSFSSGGDSGGGGGTGAF